ncbi:ATP-dependent helicase [Tessaracoccus rhinocerotis]|uniref:ATP-dependent helicase n=1 Tax=Tessaracoccus rhinocerotis TaxID=1689449 RepID=A0A553K4X7_9ACTN|nr:ATP-dependent helicase [Tessaracoccus rhinocerotis]TRY19692.1 ATP-dependent helicase [Tessaracoccus rhinocerotis]
MTSEHDALARFSGPARSWFREVFSSPTPVQSAAWDAIAQGHHALVVAPTGSGKTLAAFFHALDRLSTRPKPPGTGTRVVYLSPLKALGVDVERNLRAPLVGIRRTAERLGQDVPDVTVGVRSGDTTPRERSALVRRPPDILITTPESLYLMLTSAAQSTLTDVETVIIDEIHAIAGTKRGSHLALSLERLDALAGRDVQRVALSATVRPIETVAAFLGGNRPVEVVAPPAEKDWEVSVRLNVPDITRPGPPPGTVPEPVDPLLDAPAETTESLWPHVEADVYESVMEGRSTLVFTNSRRTAERLTARLNEIWAEQHDPDSLAPPSRRPPAQVMAASDEVGAAPAVIARAHHGSVSKEARAQIEAALKSGELRCVVATSSLELGIDMGAVDRVIQVSAPPSVASALQRIGRAGHDVGATSHGTVYPLFRGDLVPAAVVTERMLRGEIEEVHIPRSPLDVLAQQTVAAAVATGEAGLEVDQWYESVRRAMPYAGLDRALFDSVVELLTGAYPSADFGDLRARLVESDGRLHARPGALRLAVISGGTIPDRGLFGVFLAGEEGPGRRVGELDEEMVYESRVGDVFALGASSWRIVEITRDQVLVVPAPGHTGRLPFWHGEQESRPAELGRQIGRFHREVLRRPERLERPELEPYVRENIRSYLAEQREATGQVPDDTTVLVERFRDEVGDWRFVLHSPLGRAVLAPWALAIGASLQAATGVAVVPTASDDAIIWRLPDSEAAEHIIDHILPDPDDIADLVTTEVGGTALFAARFRECAARALLLPQRDPSRRSPLWQQRQRASQLLEVARHHPRFPIIIETVREVLQDVYDLPGLTELLRALRSGRVRVVEVTTPTPSPFAASMLFRYTGEFMYSGDTPLAERRAATLSMDPALLAAVLGTVDLRELLDLEVIEEVEAELQHTAPERRVRSAEELADLPRLLGPIPLEDLPQRATDEFAPGLDDAVAALAGRVFVVQLAGRPHLVAAADLGLLRDALGLPLPPGAPESATEPGRDPLTQLVLRHARTHAPFTTAQVASAFRLGTATAELVLERELAAKRLVKGHFTPGRTEAEYADPEVLRRIRSRCLNAARAQIQPVSTSGLARFLASWHGIDERPSSSPDEVLLALQRLGGAALPASAWETHVLPARLRDYSPAHLDTLIAEGEVLVRVRGALGPEDPLVALVPVGDLDLLAPAAAADPALQGLADKVAETGGLFTELRSALDGQDAPVSTPELLESWWRTAEAGLIAPSSLAPVRARVGGPTRAGHKSPRSNPRSRARLPRPGRALLARPGLDGAPPTVAGRWYRVSDPRLEVAEQAVARVSAWLERHGVITRGAVVAEDNEGGFAAAYRVLAELERAGKVVRGYVVEGLGGSQFATSATIDHIRAFADSPDETTWPSGKRRPTPAVLSALDPANPYGSVIGWPPHPSARVSRAVGAVVVLADGLCLAHLTRGGRNLTVFDPPDGAGQDRATRVSLVGAALQQAVDEKRMARIRIEEIDGARAGVGPDVEALLQAGARITPRGVSFEARRA